MLPPPTLRVRAIVATLMLSTGSLWPVHWTGSVAVARETEAPAPARQAQLIRLVRHDCGSCHGLTLAGGLGPPLDRLSLASKPAPYLQATILSGRPGTAMPPWRGLLSEAEAQWIADRLSEGFPDAH